jgi:hypothetical protein
VIYQAAMLKIERQKREVDFLETKAIGLLTPASTVEPLGGHLPRRGRRHLRGC